VSKLDDLIARIKADVVIRRTKNGFATVEGVKQRAMREARERGGDPALRALMAEANARAKRAIQHVDPYANFTEIAHAPLLQRQICRCCSGEQVNVMAELVHLRGCKPPNPDPIDVWTRRSTIVDLPIEEPLWAPTQSVTHCATCLQELREALETTFGELQSPLAADGQLALFH
jgi:hypothetical protein